MQNEIHPSFTQLAPLRSAKLFRIYLVIEECSRLCRLSWFYLAALVGASVTFLVFANQAAYPGHPLFPVVMLVMAATVLAFGWSLYTVGALHLRGAKIRTQLRLADLDPSPDTPSGVEANVGQLAIGLARVQLILKLYLGLVLALAVIAAAAFTWQAASSAGWLPRDEPPLPIAPPPPPPPAPPGYY